MYTSSTTSGLSCNQIWEQLRQQQKTIDYAWNVEPHPDYNDSFSSAVYADADRARLKMVELFSEGLEKKCFSRFE